MYEIITKVKESIPLDSPILTTFAEFKTLFFGSSLNLAIFKFFYLVFNASAGLLGMFIFPILRVFLRKGGYAVKINNLLMSCQTLVRAYGLEMPHVTLFMAVCVMADLEILEMFKESLYSELDQQETTPDGTQEKPLKHNSSEEDRQDQNTKRIVVATIVISYLLIALTSG